MGTETHRAAWVHPATNQELLIPLKPDLLGTPLPTDERHLEIYIHSGPFNFPLTKRQVLWLERVSERKKSFFLERVSRKKKEERRERKKEKQKTSVFYRPSESLLYYDNPDNLRGLWLLK